MKIVTFTDEEYEQLKPVITKFDGKVYDLDDGKITDPLKREIALIPQDNRPWLVGLSISTINDGEPLVIYNPEHITTTQHIAIHQLVKAYDELEERLNIMYSISS